MENSELKAKTKNVYQLVKALDEQRSKCSTSISPLFNENAHSLRKKLVILAESILLEDFESVGKKTREILWRKVYYDPISTSKKIWKKSEQELSDKESEFLTNFINEGIRHYKTLILKFEDVFNLDIRYIINFSIIANGADAFEKRSEKEMYTVNEINHAIETIHCFLICLGDLHRYFIEFHFDEKDVSISNCKELSASYYSEAFKLNPKNGMPQNQLGTLRAGENFELDSIFHYLYSLCSPIPVEMSEANVSKIFLHNAANLEIAEPSSVFSVKDFIMQVTLLIDIIFYDKDIAEFKALCASVILGFREYLSKDRRNDLAFQLTSILMLCLLKLRMNNSQKVACLNAFLVAYTAELVKVAISKVDDFICDHKDENMKFCEMYDKKFIEFDRKVRSAREMYKGKSYHGKETPKDSGIEKNGSGNSQKDGSGSTHLSLESKLMSSELSDKSQPGQIKIAKRPAQNQMPANHNRRRRKRRGMSGSSSDETESIYSDSENSDAESMNSDFDSYDEDGDYLDMRFSSDEDSDNAQESDGEDILIENEEIVYNNSLAFPGECNGNDDDLVIEEETIIFREDQPDEETLRLLKMKYKKKYTKIDPNLILKCCEQYKSWMQSLKILFDWLRLNTDIMLDCYRSNPEFISNIVKLTNFLNIDIFTRKIYFERSLIKLKNVRENLRYLFDSRHQIATSEDLLFKKFALFEELQQPIDWNLNYKLQITPEEDSVMRNFKMIDFGFFICKMKKFNYSFCSRSRIFIEKQGRRRRERRRDRDRRDRKRGNRRRHGGRRERRGRKSECERFEKLSIKTHSQNSQEIEEYPSIEQSVQSSRKGYLRNKADEKSSEMKERDKSEMMGKLGELWLKNEVQTLESRSKPVNINLTPYLMLDTKALTDYLHIVKNLVNTRKFVVLIPRAVLQDLDGLKKSKEGARNAIKWLESEFQRGNRFMRVQRESETLAMPFLKVPNKLERDDTVFMNIIPFANFIVSNNTSDNGEGDIPVLTLLTGDNLDRKKSQTTAINQTGILQSIPVKYDQIYRFFAKYKKK